MNKKIPGLLRAVCPLHKLSRELNCRTAVITKVHRKVYERVYPAVIVQHDGSSVNIKYYEPRQIIRLPLDISTLSEAERKARIEGRRPRTVINMEDDIEDGYDARKYLKFVKK